MSQWRLGSKLLSREDFNGEWLPGLGLAQLRSRS
jgi:hypothetical protein